MRGLRFAAFVMCFVVGTCASARWMGRVSDDPRPLARKVVRSVLEIHPHDPLVFHTGTTRFDSQASIAVYQMTILGLGQLALAHPEERDVYLPAMRRAADLMVAPETLDFGRRAWGHEGEGAYLGYVNLALGMLRLINPDTKYADLNDRLTFDLARAIDESPHGLVETYPGEWWPPDIAAVVGSIGLHAKVTHTDWHLFLDTWESRFACAIDASGYLVQRVDEGCKPLDGPRGSGTAIASYFLAFADPALSKRLERALGGPSIGGFAGIREYPPGRQGRWDVNAGPMLFGVSVGASGFGIGAARMNGDDDLAVRLLRSANLAGVATSAPGDERTYALGGLLGDALLLAMLTAHPP